MMTESQQPHARGAITRLVASKRRPEMVNVFIDDEFRIQLHIDIVSRHSLRKGMVPDAELLAVLTEDKQRQYARRLALTYVSYKPRTELQVRQRLHKKDLPSHVIDDAVDFLLEFGYLNDEEFTRMYVRDARLLRKASPRKLVADLVRKGVEKDVATRIVTIEYGSDEVLRIAREAAEKKMRAVLYRTPEKRKQAVISYMQRQGFSWDVITAVTRELLSDSSK